MKTILIKIIHNAQHKCLDMRAYFCMKDYEDLDENTYRSYVAMNMLPYDRSVLLKRLKL